MCYKGHSDGYGRCLVVATMLGDGKQCRSPDSCVASCTNGRFTSPDCPPADTTVLGVEPIVLTLILLGVVGLLGGGFFVVYNRTPAAETTVKVDLDKWDEIGAAQGDVVIAI